MATALDKMSKKNVTMQNTLLTNVEHWKDLKSRKGEMQNAFYILPRFSSKCSTFFKFRICLCGVYTFCHFTICSRVGSTFCPLDIWGVVICSVFLLNSYLVKNHGRLPPPWTNLFMNSAFCHSAFCFVAPKRSYFKCFKTKRKSS